jgi:hypothetical protein
MGRKQTKRPPKGEKTAIKSLRQQMQRNGLFKEDLMTLQETEGPKLSAVILEFIEPYKPKPFSDAAFERLVTIGVIAWNAALLEGEERQALIEATVKSIVESAGERWRKDTEEVLATMIQRKLSLFAADRRYIVDFRLADTGSDYHLSVASMPMR